MLQVSRFTIFLNTGPEPVEAPAVEESIEDVDLNAGPEPGDLSTPAGPTDAQLNAIDTYNKGVELFQIAQTQGKTGNRSGQEDLLEESIDRFEAALDLDETFVEAQTNIGFAYLTLKKEKKAIKAFKKARQMDRTHLNAINGLATAYAFRDEIEKANAVLDELTTLDPGNPQFFFNKGSILQKAELYELATLAYQEALQLDPDHQGSLFNMATLLENKGDLEEAQNYYTQAKSVDISNPVGLESLHRLDVIKQYLAKQKSTVPSDTPTDEP